MGADMPITVSQPRIVSLDGTKRYDIVRGDGRIVFVEVDAEGQARLLVYRRGESGNIEANYGDAMLFDAAVAVAKASLRGME